MSDCLYESWLIDYQSSGFNFLIEEAREKIVKISIQERKLNIFICDRDPYQFLASFLAAVSTNNHVFLGNPDWKQSEWKQVEV